MNGVPLLRYLILKSLTATEYKKLSVTAYSLMCVVFLLAQVMFKQFSLNILEKNRYVLEKKKL